MLRLRSTLLGVSLALLAPAAQALTPLPACRWDTGAQRFVEEGGVDAWVHPVVNNFALSEFSDDNGAPWGLLHHCPTGRYILFVSETWDGPRVRERLNFLIDTTVRVTMDEIGLDLAQVGARVRRGQGDVGTCDCRSLGLAQ